MDAVKKPKYERATLEQLRFYKAFVAKHPELNDRQKNAKDPKLVADLWQEMANNLNGMRGPTRTAKKWKEKIMQRKKQMRSRERKEKATRMLADHEENSPSDNEKVAFQSCGMMELGGLGDLLQVKLEDFSMESDEAPPSGSAAEFVSADPIVAAASSSTTTNGCEEKPLLTDLNSMPLPAPESDIDDNSVDCSLRPNKKLRPNDMIEMVMKSFERREERDKQMLKETRVQHQQITEMLQRVGDGLFAISKALEKLAK